MPIDDTPALIQSISEQYPALAGPLSNAAVSFAPPTNDGRQLEFYPPWEDDNPTPGKSHVQVFGNGLTGEALQSAIAGDMLHLLGGYHPDTGDVPDPKFRALKNEFAQSFTPHQHSTNLKAYEMDKASYGDVGNFDQWLDRSRTDAYIRGHLFPDKADNWRGFYTPSQIKILERMRNYLTGASDASD